MKNPRPRSRGVAITGRAIGLVGHIAEEMRNPIAYEIYERAEAEVATNATAERTAG
jgi:citrate synthase